MQTVKKQSLIAQVTEQLRGEITAGRWGVGERIPTEPELCEITGTARNTVREAVQSLVHGGLLERRQGSGTYVIATDEQEVLLGGYFGAARRQDLLELREALDVTAAVLAAQRRDADDIAALNQILDNRNRLWRRDGIDDPVERDELISADLELHRAIVVASHNAIYLSFYDSLLPTVRTFIAENGVGSDLSHEASHTGLVRAVIAGDEIGAAASARSLLRCLAARPVGE
ncbi:FadR/GntR family transcriptional regulator [Gordonia sp. CPCC 205333]|uniref:FadR/GntR family transcriptional regulator n=1 Tax=Gordonia sp. CPCC 205333 TaxID=3140790 RepID=UPI003AF34FB6